jgi:tetratricopeptide (TPR) repeat protein
VSSSPFVSIFRHARAARVATAFAVAGAVGIGYAQQQGGGQKKEPFSVGEKTSEAFQKLKPLQDAQNWDGMIALLDAVPGVKPGSYDEALILDMKAKLYIQKNQLPKAIEPWERALQLSEQHGYFGEKQSLDIMFFLAQLYAAEGTASKVPAQQQQFFTKALTYFKRFMEKTPKPTPEAMMTYASILYYKATADQNKVDQALLKEARGIVERGLMSSVKPKEGFYQLLLTLQQQQNDFAGSSEILELLLKQAPNKKDYWQLLMATYLQLSDKTKDNPTVSREYLIRAIVTCERAQALGFLNTPKDNMNLVSLYLMANQFTKGTELLYNGMKSGKIESEPNNWRVLGRYYQEANMDTQAIAVLEEATKLFPKNGELELQIAQISLQQEKTRDALQHAKAAVAKGNFESTKPFSVHYLIAYTAYDVGEIDEAAKAIAIAEKFPEAAKDPQLPKLKNVINEALAEREAKASSEAKKKEQGKEKTPAPKKTASNR